MARRSPENVLVWVEEVGVQVEVVVGVRRRKRRAVMAKRRRMEERSMRCRLDFGERMGLLGFLGFLLNIIFVKLSASVGYACVFGFWFFQD